MNILELLSHEAAAWVVVILLVFAIYKIAQKVVSLGLKLVLIVLIVVIIWLIITNGTIPIGHIPIENISLPNITLPKLPPLNITIPVTAVIK